MSNIQCLICFNFSSNKLIIIGIDYFDFREGQHIWLLFMLYWIFRLYRRIRRIEETDKSENISEDTW